MLDKKTRIAIVGGGIGGLCAGLSLLRLGFRPTIFERAPQLTEIGAGITVPPNMRRALAYLGVDDDVLAKSYRPRVGEFRDFHSGETIRRTVINKGEDAQLDSSDQQTITGTLQLHRADLQQVLLDAVCELDASAVKADHECTSISQLDEEVTVSFANGTSVTVDALIGSDGNQSIIREKLHGKDDLQFLGYGAWRGLIPASELPAECLTPDTVSYAGQGKSFIRYFVRGGELLNYVAFAERPGWTEEGWAVRSTIDELMELFGDATEEVLTIIKKTQPDACFKWALVGREPIPAWTVGRATLLGDAAHPTLPFLGQGAAMAVEDAVVLGRAFEAGDNVQNAFERYESARHARTRAVTLGAHYSGSKLHGAPDESVSEEAKQYNEEKVAAYDAVEVAI